MGGMLPASRHQGGRLYEGFTATAGVGLVPRADREEVVRAELRCAVLDWCDEQPHAALPGDVLRVPVAGVATCHAFPLEQADKRWFVGANRVSCIDLRMPSGDAGDVDCADGYDCECHGELRAR